MKKQLFLFVFIIGINTSVLSSIPPDSLRWSLGYGTLYGGGLGLKYHWNLSQNNRWQFHLAASAGLLPKTVDFIQAYVLESPILSLLSLYYLLPFHLVLPKNYPIFRNKLLVPLSLNISYNPGTKFSFFLGYGSIAQYVAYERVLLENNSIDVFNIYKLYALNLSASYKPKHFSYGLTLSSLVTPLKLNKYMFKPTNSLLPPDRLPNLYTLTFSIGYSFPDFPPKYLIPKKKRNKTD